MGRITIDNFVEDCDPETDQLCAMTKEEIRGPHKLDLQCDPAIDFLCDPEEPVTHDFNSEDIAYCSEINRKFATLRDRSSCMFQGESIHLNPLLFLIIIGICIFAYVYWLYDTRELNYSIKWQKDHIKKIIGAYNEADGLQETEEKHEKTKADAIAVASEVEVDLEPDDKADGSQVDETENPGDIHDVTRYHSVMNYIHDVTPYHSVMNFSFSGLFSAISHIYNPNQSRKNSPTTLNPDNVLLQHKSNQENKLNQSGSGISVLSVDSGTSDVESSV